MKGKKNLATESQLELVKSRTKHLDLDIEVLGDELPILRAGFTGAPCNY